MEKRIGSIRAEKYIARRAHSLEEPVGERQAVKNGTAPVGLPATRSVRAARLASGTAAREKEATRRANCRVGDAAPKKERPLYARYPGIFEQREAINLRLRVPVALKTRARVN
jgi:hypothetical protein